MTHPPVRTGLAALLLLAFAAPASPPAFAGAGPDTLTDGTWTDRWTLKNGLEVTARHIPNSGAVAVIVAYRVGRDQDPSARDGMADLLADVLLSASAGDVPERSREEMTDLRPSGWSLQVTPRFSLVSELATPERFPGLLRQTATRMRGVNVTDNLLKRSLGVVTRDLGERYLGSPELALMNQVRDLAAGVSDETLVRRAGGRAIQNVSAREATDRLGRLYVPANAVLALAGNLAGVDLRPLVSSLFEGIPGGVALREPPRMPLKAASRTITRPGLDQPLGIVGVLAPAIEDSLHPSFYLNTLMLGKFCEMQWGVAPPPLSGRYRYPLLADPQMAQFFPPVRPDETDADRVGLELQSTADLLASSTLDLDAIRDIRARHFWILGGSMATSLLDRARATPSVLHTVASTLAVRALWGSEEFWARYRQRYMDPRAIDPARWTSYFQVAGDRAVRLLLAPARR